MPGRFGNPDDIASAVSFLASNDSFVTNSVWMVVWHKSEGMTNLGKRLDPDACSEWRDYSQSVARFELESNLVEPAAYPELKVSIHCE
jgi:hypothetical protein